VNVVGFIDVGYVWLDVDCVWCIGDFEVVFG